MSFVQIKRERQRDKDEIKTSILKDQIPHLLQRDPITSAI